MVAVVTSFQSLRIVHVFRAPLGGLFRHVVDLAAEQALRGHQIGMFFDSGGDCARVQDALKRIAPLALGVDTVPIHRNPGVSDLSAFLHFSRTLRRLKPDVVHGHGSKGGAYARLARRFGATGTAICAYTPHGGSFNYKPGSLAHSLYMRAEKSFASSTDVFLFESAFIAGRFDALVGAPTRARRIVPNGLGPEEFAPVVQNADAGEFVYVGELRSVKGIDTLLQSMALVTKSRGSAPRLTLVGSGPDREALVAQAAALGLSESVRFPGPMPSRLAFALGRVLVVPSRAESMPYVVLEAGAARMPIVATHVGGIPEIFGPYSDRLGPADDPENLAARMNAALAADPARQHEESRSLSAYIGSHFSICNMTDAVLAGYREAIEQLPQTSRAARAVVQPAP